MDESLDAAYQARVSILHNMKAALLQRDGLLELKPYAPRAFIVRCDPERKGTLIG
jgi:polyribonucleotide nucleotidyltransferase